MRNEESIWRARLRARKAAQRVIDRYAIEEPDHILLRAISRDLGITVAEAPLRGATARLVHFGDSGRIRVSSEVLNEGRKRFCVAHELGHFLLKHPGLNWLACLEESMNDFGGSRMIETEANLFAVELLLPEDLVRSRCEVSPVDLRPIVEIAADFRTSVTSTALRFVQLTPERCAVVYSLDGQVNWFSKGQHFRGWLPGRGAKLDPLSSASRFFREGKLPETAQPKPPHVWLGVDSAGPCGEIVEHSMAIPSAGAVLTLLWIEDGGDAELLDDDFDDDDIEWSPYDARLRKRWPR